MQRSLHRAVALRSTWGVGSALYMCGGDSVSAIKRMKMLLVRAVVVVALVKVVESSPALVRAKMRVASEAMIVEKARKEEENLEAWEEDEMNDKYLLW